MYMYEVTLTLAELYTFSVQGATKRLSVSMGLVKQLVGLVPSYQRLCEGQAQSVYIFILR